MSGKARDNGEKFSMTGKLTLEDGKLYVLKDDDPVHCPIHNVTVRWGDLDGIQQLAVADNIDIDGDACILLPTGRP